MVRPSTFAVLRLIAPRRDAKATITAGICGRWNGVQPSFCAAAIVSSRCPLWVISVIFGARADVRFTPIADMARSLSDVCFAPTAPKCGAAKSRPSRYMI